MSWQEIGVALVVAGAVWYLAHKLFGIGPTRRKKTPSTFVTLDALKKTRKQR